MENLIVALIWKFSRTGVTIHQIRAKPAAGFTTDRSPERFRVATQGH